MKKLIITVLICLLCCVCLYMVNYPVKAATVLTENREGRDGDYTYSLWKDYGETSMTVKGDGKFECSWKDIGNALFREGIKFDCTKKYQQIGDITVEYAVDYRPDGNSYMCVYGWTRDPLVEYYIVDSWGSWRPPGAESKGTIKIDGGSYDIYETIRENQPSIDGNTTFKQYWSVRTSKRTEGTISVTEHFKAWEKLGMQMGNLYEACLTIEGYRSNGSAEVKLNKVTIGNAEKSGDNGSKNDDDSVITVKKPKCSVKLSSDKNGIRITTAKADYADGFYVYIRKSGEKKYNKVKKISKNGTVKRSCTVKNIAEGKYYIKIKAYVKTGGKTYTGKYSKTVSIVV